MTGEKAIWVNPKEGRRTNPGSRPSLEKQRYEPDNPEDVVKIRGSVVNTATGKEEGMSPLPEKNYIGET